MDWQRRRPQVWPEAAGVVVLEAEPGQDRDALIEDWLAQHRERSPNAWLLQCSPRTGGIWAGMAGLIEALAAEIRERAPQLLSRHSQELCLVVPSLRPELAVARTLTDTADDEEQTRNYAADRAYRSLHGLIDLLGEWHEADRPGSWALACNNYDDANGLVHRFFVELMRRRGVSLGLSLLVVTRPGRGDELAGEFKASSVTAKIRLPVAPRVETTVVSSDEMSRLATELERRIEQDALAKEIHLPQLIDFLQRSGCPERALPWQVKAMHLYNHAGLYEASLTYAAEVEANLDRLSADHPELYFLAVNALYFCYVPLGRVDAARAVLEEATARVGDAGALPRCYYLLAMLYARFLVPVDLVKAEDYLDRGLRLLAEVDMPEVQRHFLAVFTMNGLALVRVRQRRVQEALELCSAGIQRLNEHLDPEQHRLHRSVLLFNIAQVHAQIGPYEEAVDYFSQAMAMDPNYSEYYNDRGSVYLKIGRLDEAERDYLRAVELSPPYAEVWVNLGQCYRAMDRMVDAIRAYSRALDLDPTSVLAMVGRADAHSVIGNPDLALADYDAALVIEPAQPAVLAGRAILHFEAGRASEALRDLDAAVALAPELADLYENRAVALRELGRHNEAARDLSTYLALNPEAEDRADVESLLHSLSAPR